MKIRLEKNESDMQKATRLLSGCSEAIPSVFSNAMNRAAEQGRTAAIRCVTKEYTVKARTVRETMRIKKASKEDLSTELTSRGARLPLRDFRHSPASGDTTGSNRKQIRVAVKRGGMKPLENAFIYRGRIFQRLGSARLPVEQKFSNAVPVMLNNDAVVNEVTETMESAMGRRLDYEVKRTLAKAVK